MLEKIFLMLWRIAIAIVGVSMMVFLAQWAAPKFRPELSWQEFIIIGLLFDSLWKEINK